jgi:ABC-2 type transport system permease protein
MIEIASHTWFMLGRHTHELFRQPIWVATMLIQPLSWILLYSQLFARIVDLPGFGNVSYVQFLTPGIIIMAAFFTGMWNGMSMINDLDNGIVERFLATPARRSALVLSQVAHCAVNACVATLIILICGTVLGARVHTGFVGWIAILLASALVAAGFAGLAHAVALLTRRAETMIAISNLFGLPLVFLSGALIIDSLMPPWMQHAAHLNPVHWGVIAARGPMQADAAWLSVGISLTLLLAFAVATCSFATWAFRTVVRTP